MGMSTITIQDMRRAIAERLPPEVGFTRMEFEGPAIAIFVKHPELNVAAEESEIAKTMKRAMLAMLAVLHGADTHRLKQHSAIHSNPR